MEQIKYEEFNGKTLKVINEGEDSEVRGVFCYAVLDEDYQLWSGCLHNPDAGINDISFADKKVIELNLKFKNKARITQGLVSNYIKIIDINPDSFIDWLVYNDDYHFRRDVCFESITIIGDKKKTDPNFVTEYDSMKDSMYDAIVINKCPAGNIIGIGYDNAINVLKNAYCKKKIEIIAFSNNEETSRLFKIVINENGSMMMPLGYVEETLLPGTLSEEIEIKIAELKSKN